MKKIYKLGDYGILANIAIDMKWMKLKDYGFNNNIIDLRENVLSMPSQEERTSFTLTQGQIYCIIGKFVSYKSQYFIIMVMDNARSIVIISYKV
jgi:hypothetical protein